MQFFLPTVFIGVALLYALLILAFLWGWNRLENFSVTQNFVPTTSISVVVAARNEAENIKSLLSDFEKLNFPREKLEIFIVNDHSTDKTAQIVRELQKKMPFLKLLELPKGEKGKKKAIAYAVARAKGTLIATTDADCRVPPDWLRYLAAFYESKHPKLISAPVLMQAQNKFENCQRLEFMSLIATGAGAIALKRPIMCNGANLCYEKTAFAKHHDALNASFASGDDTLFLLRLKAENRRKIRFLKAQQATVSTRPQPTLREFLEQRRRWTSKSKAYRDFDIIATALLTFLVSLMLLTSLAISFFQPAFLKIFLSVFLLKSVPDFLILKKIAVFFEKKQALLCFLPLQSLYFFYIVWVAIFGNFGQFEWKKRKLK